MRGIKKHYIFYLIALTISITACKSTSISDSNTLPLPFSKKVTVFNITVAATESVPDNKLLHIATVLAEYLDNDEDGTVDNSNVLSEIQNSNSLVLVFENQSDYNSFDFEDLPQNIGHAQQVFADRSNEAGLFDEALEELLHFITQAGYANSYDEDFEPNPGSTLANLMDQARAGQFQTPPTNYPNEAWFTYDDPSCHYDCQTQEYIYWVISSYLGIQEHRYTSIPSDQDLITNEWGPYSRSLLESTDPNAVTFIEHNEFSLPITSSPNGTYIPEIFTITAL